MTLEKQLRRYIVPNSLAMIGMSCYILADTFFISRAAGTNGITALNLTLPVYSLIFAIGSMIGTGFAIRYALCKGLEDTNHEVPDEVANPTSSGNAGKMFSYSIEWTVLISLVFVTLGAFCPAAVLRLMGADAEILATGTAYLRIVFLCAPFFMLNYTFTAFVRNDYAPRLAMAATLTSSLFNIVFDYVLIFPLGMGMAGAALATGISPLVSMGICMTHYLSAKSSVSFRFVLLPVRQLLLACRLGISYFIGEMANGITTVAFNFILLRISGNVGVAAYGVVANFSMVAISLFNGIAQGQQPLLSELHSKGDADGKRRVLRHSWLIAFGVAVCLVVIVCIFAKPLAGLFNSEGSARLAAYAVPGLRIYFVGFLFASINIVRAGYFSATDEAAASFAVAISRGIAAIVAFAFILSALCGMTGVWLAFPAAELFTLVFVRKRGRG